MPPTKKRKLDDEVRKSFEAFNLYFCPATIGRKRLDIMVNVARENGFTVSSSFSSKVTHIVSELATQGAVAKHLEGGKVPSSWKGQIVRSLWPTECIKTGAVVSEVPYLIEPSKQATEQVEERDSLLPDDFDLVKFNQCIPERRAVLDHPNKEITDALDFLAGYWTLNGDDKRSLAFAKAAAAIKCLPFKVENASQLKGIKNLGDSHGLLVATQILQSGNCPEIEQKKNEEKYQTLKVLCNIFGVASSNANKFMSKGIRTVEDVIKNYNIFKGLNNMIPYGLAFYDDLNRPLLRNEAEDVCRLVTKIAEIVLPGVTSCLVGGFRRGKSSGHDMDVLFALPNEEDESKLLPILLEKLEQRGLVLWSRITRDVKNGHEDIEDDKLLVCYLILKYPQDVKIEDFQEPRSEIPKELDQFVNWSNQQRNWRAIRVDLISSRWSQYATALLGWTGNKQYNRALREHSKKLGYSLSNTKLVEKKHNHLIPVTSEKEIFERLNISYREPWERNF